jgi:uncharacterized protein YbaP (TraB family)
MDPDSNIAQQLAQALSHHQKNIQGQKNAQKEIEMLQDMLRQIGEISGREDDVAKS